MRFRRLGVLSMAMGFALCILARLLGGCSSVPERPNIVLISIDTLRADHLGCYGYERDTSPNIDRLARQGVRLVDGISSSSWTLPSHAAIMTGLADTVHGATNHDRAVAEHWDTLAERLRAAGYATAGFFSGPLLHPIFGFAQGFETYEDCTVDAGAFLERARDSGIRVGPDELRRTQQEITSPAVYKRASRWLKTRRNRPFLLFVHFFDVHFDFLPPAPYDTLFDPDYQGSISPFDFAFNPAVHAGMDRRDLEHLIALYDGEIAWTDLHVGKLIDDLDAQGLAEDTVIILTADHGTAFFEHGRKTHRNSVYDEVIKVPVIVRFPPRVPAKRVLKAQVRHVDLAPTILEFAGISDSHGMMGQSLVRILEERGVIREEPAVSELMVGSLILRSFRRPGYKLIVDESRGDAVLFDLDSDPGEQFPLDPASKDPLFARVARDRAWGMEWLMAYRRASVAGPAKVEIPESVMERLKSLGYVDE